MGEAFNELVKKYKQEDIFIDLLTELFDTYRPNATDNFDGYYDWFVEMFRNRGFPVTRSQQLPAYFLHAFKKRYEIPFDKRDLPEFRSRLNQQKKKRNDKAIMTGFLTFRDVHLIEAIRQALWSHDKIFVMMGAQHRGAMETVLDATLKTPVQNQDFGLKADLNLIKKDMNFSLPGNYSKELRLGKKSVLFWLIDEKPVSNTDSLSSDIEQRIKKYSPTLILTEDYQQTDSSAQTTYHHTGQNGLLRYLSEKNHLPISAWGRYLSYPYYRLSKIYPEEKVQGAIIFNYLKKNLWKFHANGRPFQDHYSDLILHLENAGFPIRYQQVNFNDVLMASLKQLPAYLPQYSEDDVINIPEMPAFSEIIRDFNRLRSDDIMATLNKQLQHHDRILLQVDKEVFRAMETVESGK